MKLQWPLNSQLLRKFSLKRKIWYSIQVPSRSSFWRMRSYYCIGFLFNMVAKDALYVLSFCFLYIFFSLLCNKISMINYFLRNYKKIALLSFPHKAGLISWIKQHHNIMNHIRSIEKPLISESLVSSFFGSASASSDGGQPSIWLSFNLDVIRVGWNPMLLSLSCGTSLKHQIVVNGVVLLIIQMIRYMPWCNFYSLFFLHGYIWGFIFPFVYS